METKVKHNLDRKLATMDQVLWRNTDLSPYLRWLSNQLALIFRRNIDRGDFPPISPARKKQRERYAVPRGGVRYGATAPLLATGQLRGSLTPGIFPPNVAAVMSVGLHRPESGRVTRLVPNRVVALASHAGDPSRNRPARKFMRVPHDFAETAKRKLLAFLHTGRP